MSQGLVTAAYIVAAILFILSLAGLAKQESAKNGNYFGIAGMVIALIATIGSDHASGLAWVIIAMIIGAAAGIYKAHKVEMTEMPELIALLHSFVGMAAVLVGYNSYLNAHTVAADMHTIHLVEVFIGVFIGAITFTGSLVAFGKLDGKIRSKPLVYPGRHAVNIALLIITIGLGVLFVKAPEMTGMIYLYGMTAIACFIGVMLVMAIGGADMPVVVSMLNSYSGWAAAAAGFMLGNDLL